jgi:hypothetical protein
MRNVLIVSAIVLCGYSLLNIPTYIGALSAQAATTDLFGYAWSDNIGWISFNCANTGSCATSNYKVTLDTATQSLSGYAWSENIGWIKFQGTKGSYTAPVSELKGFGNGLIYNPGTGNHDPNDDLEMSLNCAELGECAASNYKVQVGASDLSGYAWGSDSIGWVSFNCSNTNCTTSNYRVSFTPPCSAGYTCSTDHTQSIYTDTWCNQTPTTCTSGNVCSDSTGQCVTATPTGSLSISQGKVRAGTQVTLTWNVVNAESCIVTGTNGDSWLNATSSATVIPFPQSTPLSNEVVYSLTCIPLGGGPEVVVATERVGLIPTIKEF